jgi:hypothetical protein
MTDLIFYVIKYVLLVLVASYAILQARRQIREPREASAPSRLRLVGHPIMLLLGAISLISLVVEAWKDVQEHNRQIVATTRYTALLTSLEQNIKKTETVLTEARRLAQPVKDVYATFFITVPLSDPGLANYRQRIVAGWPSSVPGTTGPDTIVDVDPPARVWPSLETEKLAYMLLSWVKIDIDIYKNPLPPDEYARRGRSNRPIPDLQMGTSTYLDPPNPQAWGMNLDVTLGTHRLRLGVQPPRAELAAYGVRLSSRSSTGKIAAVTDLIGCRLFLKLRV